MSIDALAVGLLVITESLAIGLLGFDHGQSGVRRVGAFGLTLLQPTGDDFLRSLAVEDQERIAILLGNLPGCRALASAL